MLPRMFNFFDRLANRRIIPIVFLLLLPFNLFFFPQRSARLRELSGLPVPIIDVLFTYTPEKVYGMIAAYGEQGRQEYVATQVTLDLAYPLVLNLFFILVLISVFRRAFPDNRKMQALALLPLLAMLADYLENAGIVAMLLLYPQQPPALAQVSSLFSSAKWVLVIAVTLLFLAGLGNILFQKWAVRPVDV